MTAHPLGWSGEPKAYSTITQGVVMAFHKKMFLWHHNLVHYTHHCAIEGIQHNMDRSPPAPAALTSRASWLLSHEWSAVPKVPRPTSTFMPLNMLLFVLRTNTRSYSSTHFCARIPLFTTFAVFYSSLTNGYKSQVTAQRLRNVTFIFFFNSK